MSATTDLAAADGADDPPSSSRRAETVAKLHQELSDVQRKLQRALRLQPTSSFGDDGLVPNKNAGHVDVDFVRTKPGGLRGKIICTKKKVAVKTILHSFHADFPEGSVTALMGPSGAGKTTLLDFLTGMLGDGVHASGQVALPDNDAYVPQDDRLHSFYTCQSYMEHYARITGMKPLIDCCSSKKKASGTTIDTTDEEGLQTPLQQPVDGTVDVDQLIGDVLSEVGLTNQVNTVVGGMFKRGLSGGQKRRLSVALEALSSPLNLFLDEPTSGLDSESALGLMEYLHTYARGKDPKTGRGRRVIVTIHQPSSQIWEAIDNVVLLAEGRLMYQGPRKKMGGFYAAYGHPVPVHYNPADHFIEVLFKLPDIDADTESEMPEDPNLAVMWNKCFRQWSNDERESISQPGQSLSKAKSMVVRKDPEEGRRHKLKTYAKRNYISAVELTRRSFSNLFRNPAVLGLRVAIYGGMSLVIGILFFGLSGKDDVHSIIISRTALLYFILAYCSSMSVAVIPFAMVDRGIVQKEVRNHLFHPAFFHASQALAGIPVCLVLSALVSVIVLLMTGIKGNVGFFFILFLTFLCADATSMFVAHIAPEMISALCISSGIFGVFTMVMGFLVTPSQFPTGLGWLYYIPFMTYSFRSLMYIEYHDAVFNVTGMIDNMPDIPPIPNIPPQMSDLLFIDPGVIGGFMNTTDISGGNAILKSFEMENINVARDNMILVLWLVVMHSISIIYLCWSHFKSRRTFVYSDGE